MWGATSLPEADLVGFAALRESVASARRRRRGWAFAALLSLPVVILAAYAMLSAALLAVLF